MVALGPSLLSIALNWACGFWHLLCLPPGDLLLLRLGGLHPLRWLLCVALWCMSLLGYFLVCVFVILSVECNGISYDPKIVAATPCCCPTSVAFASSWSDPTQFEETEIGLYHTSGAPLQRLALSSPDSTRDGCVIQCRVDVWHMPKNAQSQCLVLRFVRW